jgi:hypothetical protein
MKKINKVPKTYRLELRSFETDSTVMNADSLNQNRNRI